MVFNPEKLEYDQIKQKLNKKTLTNEEKLN